MRASAIRTLLLGFCVVALLSGGARAEDRSVNVIEGAPELQAPATPPASTPAPSTPSSSTMEPTALRTDNGAGLRLTIRPGSVLPIGTNVTFDIATTRKGYLVLVDINADRQVTQIYPNIDALVRTNAGKTILTNLMQPGTVLTVPNLRNPLAQFEFKAEQPAGRGIIVAVLSERAVQVIDLPDLPSTVTSSQEVVDFLDKSIRALKVAEGATPDDFYANSWSFVATEYVIR